MTKTSERCTYVLDTNVLLNFPDCVKDDTFTDTDIYIPEVVINELEKFKKEDTERSFRQRIVTRNLNDLRAYGKLKEGIALPNGNTLTIVSANGEREIKLMDDWDPHDPDHLIAKTAVRLGTERGRENTYLVTSDLLLILRADTIGLQTKELTADQNSLYTGYREAYAKPHHFCNLLLKTNQWELDSEELFYLSDGGEKIPLVERPRINEFVAIYNPSNPTDFRLSRFNGECLVPLKNDKRTVSNISARGIVQRFMMESLIVPEDEQRLVIIEGPAGGGKTLLSLAAGIQQKKDKRFFRFFYTRANVEADNSYGFLPGDIDEKMDWLLNPIYDNLFAIDNNLKYSTQPVSVEKKQETLDIFGISARALNHMRGRSLPKCFVLVDEVQNLTREQVKMVVTRAGKGTVVVLIGDTSQIDAPYLNYFNNGLTHAFNAMDNEPLCYRLRLGPQESQQRSVLAQAAAARLGRHY